MSDTKRVTVDQLERLFHAPLAELRRLADYGSRRFHPVALDFDSRSLFLDEPEEHWEEQVKQLRHESRARILARLKEEYGSANHAAIVDNFRDLGMKSMSLVAYHNRMHQEARTAFIVGAYYPALVAACSLGERILNHLVLDLREDFRASPTYKRVYSKSSFDHWPTVIDILEGWHVLVSDAADKFRELSTVRNRSVHFNLETYKTLRDDALLALKLLGNIIDLQFGIGKQPWFIKDTPGHSFVSRDYENVPFVRTYLLPSCAFVGPLFGMEMTPGGQWRHLDHRDYGDTVLSDAEFACAYRERDPSSVVTREMVEASNLHP